MRQKFENDLVSMSEIAKDELNPESVDVDIDLSQVVEYRLRKIAERQHTNIEVQREIYNIQKNKQEVMGWLKVMLAKLDNPDAVVEKVPGERNLEYDKNKKLFIYADDNGKRWYATFGQIMSDMDWGVQYSIDTKSIPRSMAKRYLIKMAKKKIMDLLGEQIIRSEIGGDLSHEFKKEAYSRIQSERESGQVTERWGFISEKIVKNFLEKASIDHDLPFEIHDADVFQDVEQKIDFIIHLKDKSRGVNVESSEDIKDIGIQFTVNPNTEYYKKNQIRRAKRDIKEDVGEEKKRKEVDDIVLVIFPLNIARDMKNNWIKGGRRSGGPSGFMYRSTAEKMFKSLLVGVFSEEKIGEFWEKVKKDFIEQPI